MRRNVSSSKPRWHPPVFSMPSCTEDGRTSAEDLARGADSGQQARADLGEVYVPQGEDGQRLEERTRGLLQGEHDAGLHGTAEGARAESSDFLSSQTFMNEGKLLDASPSFFYQ
jgi:hypothetical protein